MTQSMEKEQLFTSVPIGRTVISLAVPTVIAQLITVVCNMADIFFIGQLGDPDQVAAATLAMPIFMLLTAFANLFGIGGASMISRCLGAGDREKARQTAAFCIWSAALVSLCYGAAVLLLRGSLLPLLGADGDTSGFCSTYLFWTVGIGASPTVLNACLAHLVRSEGYAGQASFDVAFGGVLNIILDPVFIFLFRMEIAGAAIATMLSNAAAVAYFFAFLFRIRRSTAITSSPKCFTLGRGIPAEVLAVALNFLAITIFQATGKRVQPLILSLLRKGGLDIPLMLLFNALVGVNGIAWATPLADTLALLVSAALVLPYLKKLARGAQ